MDWDLAIEINRAALKRIVAMLMAMAGFTGAAVATPTRQTDDCGPLLKEEVGRRTLSRHLHRAVLRFLRPAESAARRLVIAAARDMLVVHLRPVSGDEVGSGLGTPVGVCAPPPLTPPHKGEGTADVTLGSPADALSASAAQSPSPLWGGVRGGGAQAVVLYTDRRTHGRKAKPGSRRRATGGAAIRGHTLPLLDPLPRFRPFRPIRTSVPRISVPGVMARSPIPPAPTPDDPINATRLVLRLLAIETALDDLPGHARRFARWRQRAAARADYNDSVAAGMQGSAFRAPATGHVARNGKPRPKIIRLWPLRMGRPPGWRRKGDPEVQEVLARTTGLALYALAGHDTS